MMSVGLHCRLVGRPGRAAALVRFLDHIAAHEQVWVATPARHCAALAREHKALAAERARSSAEQHDQDFVQSSTRRLRRFRRRARRTSTSTPRGLREPSARERPFATLARAPRGDGRGRAQRAARSAAGPDQGPSRSRRQSRARRHADPRIPKPSRQAPASTGYRSRNTRDSIASMTTTARNSPYPSSSACAGTPRIPSCASSSAACSNPVAAETETALAEIFRIAALRLDQRIEAADRPQGARPALHPCARYPAAAIPAAGRRRRAPGAAANGESVLIATAVTNSDGRTDKPLIAGRPLPIGGYELRFAVGDYFARQGASSWPSRRFSMSFRCAFPLPSPKGITTSRCL